MIERTYADAILRLKPQTIPEAVNLLQRRANHTDPIQRAARDIMCNRLKKAGLPPGELYTLKVIEPRNSTDLNLMVAILNEMVALAQFHQSISQDLSEAIQHGLRHKYLDVAFEKLAFPVSLPLFNVR